MKTAQKKLLSQLLLTLAILWWLVFFLILTNVLIRSGEIRMLGNVALYGAAGLLPLGAGLYFRPKRRRHRKS